MREVSRKHSGAVGRAAPKLMLQPIRFGEYLFEKNLINDEQLLEALAHHWSTGERIGNTIGRFGFLTTEEVERQAMMYHALDVVEIA